MNDFILLISNETPFLTDLMYLFSTDFIYLFSTDFNVFISIISFVFIGIQPLSQIISFCRVGKDAIIHNIHYFIRIIIM